MLGCSRGGVHSANEVPSGRGKAPFLSSADSPAGDCPAGTARGWSPAAVRAPVSQVWLLNLNSPDKRPAARGLPRSRCKKEPAFSFTFFYLSCFLNDRKYKQHNWLFIAYF